jgi:hypothetical protein
MGSDQAVGHLFYHRFLADTFRLQALLPLSMNEAERNCKNLI